MANQMRDRWAAGGTALGAWISLRDPIIAEVAGGLGFDYVCIDLQHGLNDYDGMANALAAMAAAAALIASAAHAQAWFGTPTPARSARPTSRPSTPVPPPTDRRRSMVE